MLKLVIYKTMEKNSEIRTFLDNLRHMINILEWRVTVLSQYCLYWRDLSERLILEPQIVLVGLNCSYYLLYLKNLKFPLVGPWVD